MSTKRMIIGLGNNNQGIDETITYTLDTTNFPAGPANAAAVTVKIYLLPDLTDVTSAVTSGSTTVDGRVITLPSIKSLTAGNEYRIEIKWTATDSDIYEAFGILTAER